MKVVGYIRVSTVMQTKGYSLENQMKKIEEYCSLMDYTLVDIFEDRGITGMSLSKRDGYSAMLKYIEEKDCEGVVAYSLSRVGRNMKDVVNFLDVLKVKGKLFFSVKENLSNNDKVGSLILNIMSSINQFEVEQLRDRVRDVKRAKKEANLVYGRLRYGWDKCNGILVVNEEEQKVIRRVKNLRTRGHSWNKIAMRLNDESVGTKHGGIWNSGSLFNVMKYACS